MVHDTSWQLLGSSGGFGPGLRLALESTILQGWVGGEDPVWGRLIPSLLSHTENHGGATHKVKAVLCGMTPSRGNPITPDTV